MIHDLGMIANQSIPGYEGCALLGYESYYDFDDTFFFVIDCSHCREESHPLLKLFYCNHEQIKESMLGTNYANLSHSFKKSIMKEDNKDRRYFE